MKFLLFAAMACITFPATAERIDLKMTGSQGDHYFFTVPKSHSTDQKYLIKTAEGFCFNKVFCYVHFWESGGENPKKFPLSEMAEKTELASYTSNKKTGKKQMLWRCTKFPTSTKANCFS